MGSTSAYETGLEFLRDRRWSFVPWGEIAHVTEKQCRSEEGELLHFYLLRCSDGRRLFLNSTLSDIGRLEQIPAFRRR